MLEGIPWEGIDYPDNVEIVALLESRTAPNIGLLALLDDPVQVQASPTQSVTQCRLPVRCSLTRYHCAAHALSMLH